MYGGGGGGDEDGVRYGRIGAWLNSIRGGCMQSEICGTSMLHANTAALFSLSLSLSAFVFFSICWAGPTIVPAFSYCSCHDTRVVHRILGHFWILYQGMLLYNSFIFA